MLTISMITREAMRVLDDSLDFSRQMQEITDSMAAGPEREAALRNLCKAHRDRDIADLERLLPSPEAEEAIRHIRAIWSKQLGEED